jgi:hypothetical protein
LLKNYKSISEAHIQMISGGIAVFSVNLIMGFYAYLVANDPENFIYE